MIRPSRRRWSSSRAARIWNPSTTPPSSLPQVDDGGFYYTIAAGGSSQAGKTADGGLRSYGSMTYAGLRSLIYAGLKKDDPRVKAAYRMDQEELLAHRESRHERQGLYYYYHTFAKTMAALGDDEFVDASGKSHNWRAELANQLISHKRKTAPGSTRPLAGSKATQIWSPLTRCSRCRYAQPK